MESTVTEERLLTRGEVEHMVGLRRSALYQLLRDGEFPKPYRATGKAVRWRLTEVQAWIAARPRASRRGRAA